MRLWVFPSPCVFTAKKMFSLYGPCMLHLVDVFTNNDHIAARKYRTLASAIQSVPCSTTCKSTAPLDLGPTPTQYSTTTTTALHASAVAKHRASPSKPAAYQEDHTADLMSMAGIHGTTSALESVEGMPNDGCRPMMMAKNLCDDFRVLRRRWSPETRDIKLSVSSLQSLGPSYCARYPRYSRAPSPFPDMPVGRWYLTLDLARMALIIASADSTCVCPALYSTWENYTPHRKSGIEVRCVTARLPSPGDGCTDAVSQKVACCKAR